MGGMGGADDESRHGPDGGGTDGGARGGDAVGLQEAELGMTAAPPDDGASRSTDAGPAGHPHQLRRHRLLGRRPHHGRRRHRRGRVHPARKPDDLEGQDLGDGPRHQGRPVRDRRS